jgi:hypothetical protein
MGSYSTIFSPNLQNNINFKMATIQILANDHRTSCNILTLTLTSCSLVVSCGPQFELKQTPQTIKQLVIVFKLNLFTEHHGIKVETLIFALSVCKTEVLHGLHQNFHKNAGKIILK